MRKNILVVMLIAVITLVNAFAFAANEDVMVYRGLSEAVSALEDGGLKISEESQEVNKNATIRVQLDGNYLDFTDSEGNVVNPQIINNRTMVPMRKIFETFNAQVGWEESTKTVTATTAEKVITLAINDANAKVKDVATGVENTITLDQPAVLRDNRTLVPVRFIAESLNKDVEWDDNARTVVIIDFDKLAGELRTQAPALQKLFDMNIENVESFKSTSNLNGTISYTDEGAQESITITGNAKVASNKSEDMEGDVALSIKGNGGEISSAVANSGYENFNAKVVLKGDKLYVGLLEGDKYTWTDASSSLSTVNNVSIAYNVDKINSYESVIGFIKSTIGDINSNSYATLKSVIGAFGTLITDDSITLAENGTEKTLNLKLDVGALLNAYSNSASEDDLGLVFTLQLVANNGLVQREKMNINGKFTIAGEALDLALNIDSTYDELNKDFTIEAPAV